MSTIPILSQTVVGSIPIYHSNGADYCLLVNHPSILPYLYCSVLEHMTPLFWSTNAYHTPSPDDTSILWNEGSCHLISQNLWALDPMLTAAACTTPKKNISDSPPKEINDTIDHVGQ